MRRRTSTAGLLLVSLMLTGCQVLASVFEEQVLRTAAIVLCVAVVIGFVVARMRR